MGTLNPRTLAGHRCAEASEYFRGARDLACRMPQIPDEHKRDAARTILSRLRNWLASKHAERSWLRWAD